MKHYIFKNGVAVLLCLLSITSLAQSSEGMEETLEQINAYYKKLHSEEKGGAAIAVVKDGEVVYKTAYGMANLEYNIPNELNTVFHAASLSKQFTAYAILLLEQQQQLSLEDDIHKYIPELPDFGEKITLRHLANHQSGLRDQWRLLYMAGWRPDDVILNQDILDLVYQQEALNFTPGTKVMYSNTGFTLLAEVVARVSGMTFAEFTQANIFTPLKMSNSQFYDDYQKVVKNRAYSYQEDEEVIKKDRLNFSTVGATSLFTTVMDLCKWGIHLNTLSTSNPKLAKSMHQPVKLDNGEVTESINGQWGLVKFHGLEWLDHSGSDASYRAYFARFPASNSAVAILANATPIDASGLAMGTAEIFLEEYFVEESSKKDKPAAILAREQTYKSISLSTEHMARFCGKYWEPEEGYDRTIKLVNDTLVYYRSASSQTKLLPVAKNEFKMLGDNNDVSVFFETDSFGASVMRLNISDERTVNFVKYDATMPANDVTGSFYSKELKSTVEVYLEDESIHAKLFKHEPVRMEVVKKDLFKGSDRTFSKVEFVRNAKGDVIHLLVSNGGTIGVRFDKQ